MNEIHAIPVPPGPRQVIATLPQEALLDLIAGRRRITNLPASAKIISCWWDCVPPNGRVLRMRLEDASFAETVVGGRFPRLRLRATRGQ